LKDNDYIKELFKDSLENLETPVRPELWNAVASSISASSAPVVGSTIFSASKLIIASITLLTIGGFTYYFSINTTPQKTLGSSQMINKPSNVEVNQVSRNEKTPVKTHRSNIKINNSIIHQDLSNQTNLLPIEDLVNTVNITPGVSNSNNPVLDNRPSELASNVIEKKSNQIPVSTSLIEETNQSINNIETTDHQFVLPNVFTPNNDGSNDKFEINGINLSDFSLVIINSKNETVFQATDILFSWDGRLPNGELVSPGNYIYYIVGKTASKAAYTKIKQLTIIY
jgi:gliding motility-associated-like protein